MNTEINKLYAMMASQAVTVCEQRREIRRLRRVLGEIAVCGCPINARATCWCAAGIATRGLKGKK